MPRRSLRDVSKTTVISRLAQLLVGTPYPQATNAPVALWLARLQREDNPWLKAERMELQGQLADARRLYLQDAARQQEQGRHALAALSRAASAEMTARLGDAALARWELHRAAELFRVHAEQAAEWSIREAAWAYERAAALYRAAGAGAEAATMQRCAADLIVHLAPPVDDLDVRRTLLGNARAQ